MALVATWAGAQARVAREEPAATPFAAVDPFIGTGGEGHTYPGATVPFGMVQVSLDTEIKFFRQSFPWAAGYRHGDPTILGFSHTHFSGTGHSDLGDVLLVPTVGEVQLEAGTAEQPEIGYRSRYSSERAEPGYYAVRLDEPGVDVELTATSRVGMHRYRFPTTDRAHVVLDLVSSIYNYDGKVLWSTLRVDGDRRVTGSRVTKGWAPGRTIFFALEFSRPFSSYGIVKEGEEPYRGFGRQGPKLDDYPEAFGRTLRAHFDFAASPAEPLLVKVAISAVGVDGARRNLEAEIPGWDFDAVRRDARTAWERALGTIAVEADARTRRIFYTALYHAMLAPVAYSDVDGRYRGADGVVRFAEGFTDYHVFSLWDTFRAAHPLLTVVDPARDADMIRSMLAHRRESAHGILPVWSFGGFETWCMIGYHAVPVIADAYLKGIRGFDADEALAAMVASATYAPYGGLGAFMRHGFVPIDLEKEGASKTLEYAYDDWTIAEMARAMGRADVEREFRRRAASYRAIFDPATGFMRARTSGGAFREPFDPLWAQYGGDYTEGNAWQYSWFVPHDVAGLIELMGGPGRFVQRLDELFALEAGKEKYGHVEDIAGLIGQYAHGNEPSQHIAYLYAYAGRPWRTQERIRQIVAAMFDDTPAGIAGNEDCGQMSAWYVFTALGFYPVAPGSGEYVFGTPLLPRATIHLPGGRTFTVVAQGLSEKNLYIRSATLNGEPYGKAYLRHADLAAGGTLAFVMGPAPDPTWASGPDAAPYSMSRSR